MLQAEIHHSNCGNKRSLVLLQESVHLFTNVYPYVFFPFCQSASVYCVTLITTVLNSCVQGVESTCSKVKISTTRREKKRRKKVCDVTVCITTKVSLFNRNRKDLLSVLHFWNFL